MFQQNSTKVNKPIDVALFVVVVNLNRSNKVSSTIKVAGQTLYPFL